jgi:hypothetical protein
MGRNLELLIRSCGIAPIEYELFEPVVAFRAKNQWVADSADAAHGKSLPVTSLHR